MPIAICISLYCRISAACCFSFSLSIAFYEWLDRYRKEEVCIPSGCHSARVTASFCQEAGSYTLKRYSFGIPISRLEERKKRMKILDRLYLIIMSHEPQCLSSSRLNLLVTHDRKVLMNTQINPISKTNCHILWPQDWIQVDNSSQLPSMTLDWKKKVVKSANKVVDLTVARNKFLDLVRS